MSFYNTTNEVNPALREMERKAGSQEREVLNIFRKSTSGLTASEVFRKYPQRNVPLTSIRRAITNLSNDRFLDKTEIKREGIYGRKEFVYIIYTGQTKLF